MEQEKTPPFFLFRWLSLSRKAARAKKKWPPYASLRTSHHAARSGRAPTSPRRARSLNARAAPKKERGGFPCRGAVAFRRARAGGAFRLPMAPSARGALPVRLSRTLALACRALACRALAALTAGPEPRSRARSRFGSFSSRFHKAPAGAALARALAPALGHAEVGIVEFEVRHSCFSPEGFGVGTFSPKAVRFFFRPRDGPAATGRKKFVHQSRENTRDKKEP